MEETGLFVFSRFCVLYLIANTYNTHVVFSDSLRRTTKLRQDCTGGAPVFWQHGWVKRLRGAETRGEKSKKGGKFILEREGPKRREPRPKNCHTYASTEAWLEAGKGQEGK